MRESVPAQAGFPHCELEDRATQEERMPIRERFWERRPLTGWSQQLTLGIMCGGCLPWVHGGWQGGEGDRCCEIPASGQGAKQEAQRPSRWGHWQEPADTMPWLEGPEAASLRSQCHGKIQGAGIRMRSRDWPAGGVRGLAGSEAVVREWDRGVQLEMSGDDRARQRAATVQWR